MCAHTDILEKSIGGFTRMPGDFHHLRELQDLERLFYRTYDFEGFHEKLVKFIDEHFPSAKKGIPLTQHDLRLIDEFVQSHFQGFMEESHLWVTRAFVIGKLVENRERVPSHGHLINVEELPGDVAEAIVQFKLSSREATALKWAHTDTASRLSNATSDTVATVRSIIAEGVKNRLSHRQIQKRLEQEFFNDDSESRRSWARVAITEMNAAFNNGYLAQLVAGEWVIGMSMPDACPDCKRLIAGKVYPLIEPKEVSDYSTYEPESREYERHSWLWEHTVWTNKDNVGRSRSEQKKKDRAKTATKDNLTERGHHEKWMPCIPLHPYCRCRWIRFNPDTQYMERGEMRLKFMDAEAHEKWYNEHVAPVREKLDEWRVV